MNTFLYLVVSVPVFFSFCFTSQNDSIGGLHRGDGESKCWVTLKNEWGKMTGAWWHTAGDRQDTNSLLLTIACSLKLPAELQPALLHLGFWIVTLALKNATTPEKSAKWRGLKIFPVSIQPEHFVFLFWSRDLKNVLSVLSHWAKSWIFWSLRSPAIFSGVFLYP